MRVPAGVFSSLLLAVTALGAMAWFLLYPSYDLLRCNAALLDKQYYQVSFDIDYATRLDRLFSLKGQADSDKTASSIGGKFIMELTGTADLNQPGEVLVRILDLSLNEPGDSRQLVAGQPAMEMKILLDDGCRLSVVLPVGDIKKVESMISRLLSVFTFQVPERYATSWQAEHSDNIGDYLADYQLSRREPDEQVINRKRNRYQHLSVENQQQGLTPRIIESSAVARLVSGEPWFHALEGIEDISLLHAGSAVVQTRMTYAVKHMDDGFVVSSSQLVAANEQSSPSVASNAAASEEVNKSRGRPYTTVTADDGSIVEKYMSLLATGKIAAALDYLVNALRVNPDFAYTLKRQILNESLGRKGAPLAFLALGKSDTDQGYAVLVELLEVPDAPVLTRSRAAYALAESRPASMDVVQVLAMQLERAPVANDLASQSALLAMGIMMNKIENENDPAKAMLRDLIGNQLTGAGNEQSLRSALAAASNAADKQLYPMVIEQLDHESPAIRQLAVEVIGKSDSGSSRHDLVNHFSNERDAGVRAATLNSLTSLLSKQGTPASNDEVALIAGALTSENDVGVKSSMIRLLGSQSGNSAARAALAEQVRTEKNPELLKQLGRVLPAETLMSIRRGN